MSSNQTFRRQEALRRRVAAAELANSREHPRHLSNGDELRFRRKDGRPSYIASFTKGLPHVVETGALANPNHFSEFVRAINSADPRDFRALTIGPLLGLPGGRASELDPRWQSNMANTIAVDQDGKPGAKIRAWESAGAGSTYSLEGPDAQAVTMPPAPLLDSRTLALEMTEVYAFALLRDIPFAEWESKADEQPLKPILRTLNSLRDGPEVTVQNLLRGEGEGVQTGPYLSQFLLRGNASLGSQGTDSPLDGFVRYGALRVDQRVRVAEQDKDYMTNWEQFIDVQDGADLRGLETYDNSCGKPFYRFITTPRDLATYVHYDALYEAYLNATLILLADGTPFDAGLPFNRDDEIDRQSGFATFGAAHILSLVTEVATRALKAVRFQKFNIHRRLRPEAVGGLIHQQCASGTFPEVQEVIDGLGERMLRLIERHNKRQNRTFPDRKDDPSSSQDNFLLPMAFPEGSPMHPTYGAGHAAVAGACVTILKAWFDAETPLDTIYFPSSDGLSISSRPVGPSDPKQTVGGELNKLAANISIGRNVAGVHYYSDYRESIRLGERVAIGILEEQKLLFSEEHSFTLSTFDGATLCI